MITKMITVECDMCDAQYSRVCSSSRVVQFWAEELKGWLCSDGGVDLCPEHRHILDERKAN